MNGHGRALSASGLHAAHVASQFRDLNAEVGRHVVSDRIGGCQTESGGTLNSLILFCSG